MKKAVIIALLLTGAILACGQDGFAEKLSEAALLLTEQVVEDCLFDFRIIGHYIYTDK